MPKHKLEQSDSDLFSNDRYTWDPFARVLGHSYEYFDDEHSYFEYLRSLERRGLDAEVIFAHEKAHSDASRAIGISNSQFGMRTSGPKLEIVHPFIRHGVYRDIPRLALGSVIVAPVDPSRTDMNSLGELGYESTDQVHGKIESWNDSNQLQLPLPGSLDIRNQ